MIENLNGMHETVTYRENMHLRFYNNCQTDHYPLHWHTPIEIIMPIENNYTAIINGRSLVFDPYEILIIAPGVIHEILAPPTGRRYIFQADLSILKDISGISAILSFINPYFIFTQNNAPNIYMQLKKIILEISDEYFKGDDLYISQAMPTQGGPLIGSNNFCEPAIYAKLITMLTLIGRNHIEKMETDSTNQIKRQEYIHKFMMICDYIEEHYTEDLILEDVAQLLNFSKFHFSRLFKQFTNVSFYKYVNQKRIAHAEELLTKPDISITQVAIHSGFSSTSAFIRMFKIMKGCTPTDFKKIQQHKM